MLQLVQHVGVISQEGGYTRLLLPQVRLHEDHAGRGNKPAPDLLRPLDHIRPTRITVARNVLQIGARARQAAGDWGLVGIPPALLPNARLMEGWMDSPILLHKLWEAGEVVFQRLPDRLDKDEIVHDWLVVQAERIHIYGGFARGGADLDPPS